MYTNNGFKFFDKMYDYIILEDIRKEPITKNEFLNAGYSEDIFNQYILFIKRLYGECFIESYNIAVKYATAKFNESLWAEFIDFCIENKLLQEFTDETGNRMPVFVPPELLHWQFIYDYPECPDCIHICSIDEFRLKIEMLLTDKYDDAEWYLNVRYDVRRIFKDNKEYIARYDINLKEFVQLEKNKIDSLLQTINNDINTIAEAIDFLKTNKPESIESAYDCKNGVSASVYFEILDNQKKWLDEYSKLENKAELLNDCYILVLDSIGIDFDEEQSDEVVDTTLYIYKGHILCEQEHHNTEQAIAVLQDLEENEIELNCMHCITCNKFYMSYTTYNHYREKYGVILGDIRMIKSGSYDNIDYELADESPLKLCGYSVSQKNGLNTIKRQSIIAWIIDNEIMSKHSVIQLLNWFIDVNGNKKGNELARKKWCEDLDFVLAYNSEKQKHYKISDIKPYNKNRFYICEQKQKTIQKNKIPTEKFLNKRVLHKKYGVGTIVDIENSIISILFENCKTIKFTNEILLNGIVSII